MDFSAFDTSEIQRDMAAYAAEARERWGSTEAYAESQRRTASYDKQAWSQISAQQNELFSAFAALRGTDPAAPDAQALVRRWQAHITDHFYPCPDEILAGLGEMYVADERFATSLNQHGEGTAQFMSEAIAQYCKCKK